MKTLVQRRGVALCGVAHGAKCGLGTEWNNGVKSVLPEMQQSKTTKTSVVLKDAHEAPSYEGV